MLAPAEAAASMFFLEFLASCIIIAAARSGMPEEGEPSAKTL